MAEPELQIVSMPSWATAMMEHHEVDGWRWQPGMLALPVHDAPWWYEDEIHPRYATPAVRVRRA